MNNTRVWHTIAVISGMFATELYSDPSHIPQPVQYWVKLAIKVYLAWLAYSNIYLRPNGEKL